MTIMYGQTRFIRIDHINITTTFTVLTFIVSFAGFIEKAKGKGYLAILRLFAVAVISVSLVFIQPYLMEAFILLVGYFVLIVSAIIKNHFGGNRMRQIILLGILSGLGCTMLLILFFSYSYAVARLNTYVVRVMTGEYSFSIGAYYQPVMADSCLAASKLIGAATGTINGIKLVSWLPAVTSDYVIVNVIASFGWVAGIILIASIAVYISRMPIVIKKIKDSFGFYISLGACTVLAVEFVMGILINFNLLPPASVCIPFISYGGTGYIMNMAFIGLILSVWRRNNLVFISSSVSTARGQK